VATESDLRDLLRGPAPEGRAEIDLDAVLSRTRRRRRPRVIVAQALGSVALVGVLGTVAVVAIPRADQAVQMTAEDAGAGSEEAATSPYVDDDARAVYDVCGEPLVTPPPLGWNLDAALGTDTTVSDDSGTFDATINLRNDSVLTATGVADISSVAIVRDGVVVAHGIPIDAAATPIELAPNAVVTWNLVLSVASCDPTGGPLPAGGYEARAVVEFLADGLEIVEPVRGIPTIIEFR
jgi:type II secretory pathway pseudopilin PulG